MSDQRAFTRDELLSGVTLKKKFVALDDGRGVWIRDVSPKDYVDYLETAKKPECEKISDSLLLAKSICGPEGNRLFTDEEYPLIAEKFSMGAQRKIVGEFLEWQGVSKQQIEQAEKN